MLLNRRRHLIITPPITLPEVLEAIRVSDDLANEEQPDFSGRQFAKVDSQGNTQNWRVLLLNGCRVNDADLADLDLSHLSLVDSEMRRSNVDRSHLWHADLTRAELQHSSFRNCNLGGANLHEAKMEYTNFEDATLSHATMTGVRAYKMQAQRCYGLCTNFYGAMLQWANFTHATLEGANFKNADLTGVDFSYADIRGVELHGAMLLDTKFHDAEQVLTANLKGIKDSFMMYIMELDLKQLRVYRERIALRSGSADLTNTFGVEPPYLVQRFFTNLFSSDQKDQPIRSIVVSWLDTWIAACNKATQGGN